MDDDEGTDAPLVRRLANGDRAALADAFDRFAPTLVRSAWPLAASRQDVEEIVQDTFLTLWQQAATIDPTTTALLPWLLVVCRDRAQRDDRSRARRTKAVTHDEL